MKISHPSKYRNHNFPDNFPLRLPSIRQSMERDFFRRIAVRGNFLQSSRPKATDGFQD